MLYGVYSNHRVRQFPAEDQRDKFADKMDKYFHFGNLNRQIQEQAPEGQMAHDLL